MLISHSKRFVFLANPKTGSVSVQAILRPCSEVKSLPEKTPCEVRRASGLHNHITAPDLVRTFAERGWNWSDYFSFTMIRNPWDRIVSAYEYGRRNVETMAHEQVAAAGSFAQFAACAPVRLIERHAFDSEGRRLVGEIVRLEDIAVELPRILKMLGIPFAKIPHRNATDRGHYRDYYDDETREAVARSYARDIEIGGYCF
ncbi:MAG: sulfotransferase family 2 domain-containing protein [Chthoniobacterales bacterium]